METTFPLDLTRPSASRDRARVADGTCRRRVPIVVRGEKLRESDSEDPIDTDDQARLFASERDQSISGHFAILRSALLTCNQHILIFFRGNACAVDTSSRKTCVKCCENS